MAAFSKRVFNKKYVEKEAKTNMGRGKKNRTGNNVLGSERIKGKKEELTKVNIHI